MDYWLFKSEPASFSLDDLKNRPDMTEHWDGVRNYQARNFLRDAVQVGDRVLVNKLVYRFREPRRSEVIVFENPQYVEEDRNPASALWHAGQPDAVRSKTACPVARSGQYPGTP